MGKDAEFLKHQGSRSPKQEIQVFTAIVEKSCDDAMKSQVDHKIDDVPLVLHGFLTHTTHANQPFPAENHPRHLKSLPKNAKRIKRTNDRISGFKIST